QMKLRCQAAVAAPLANEPIQHSSVHAADVRSGVRNGLKENSVQSWCRALVFFRHSLAAAWAMFSSVILEASFGFRSTATSRYLRKRLSNQLELGHNVRGRQDLATPPGVISS